MRPENSPDGQRKSFIEEARRRQIIASAVQVISESGYAAASLARIAEHAGISKGVISYHFAGKDELMEQLVVQLYISGGEYMAPKIGAVRGLREQLRTYIATNLEFIDANRTYIAALHQVVLNLRDSAGNLRFATSDGEQAIIQPLIDLLAQGQAAAEFGTDFDPVRMAESIRDAIDGAAARAARSADFDTTAYSAHICRVFDIATQKAGQS
ncbi:helix-turn-helix domain-containing protein [Nocardia sp. NPDC050435]|uniref:TetR/AcrR family transcriptional regulator n=1 Tax=Nocardia sp. NPDC050435 TaxID=3155040 RepID=UPI0034049521